MIPSRRPRLRSILFSSFLSVVVPLACSSSDGPATSPQDAGTPTSDADAIVEASAPPTCQDGIKNGDEADVDCGFACEIRCAASQTCNGHLDCESGVCTQGTCQGRSDTNGVKDGSETDVDCGGPDARKCVAPQACKADRDCVSRACTEGRCAPSHSDGAQNMGETDIDCGGTTSAPRCPSGRACSGRDDCLNGGDCVSGICQAPTPGDGVQNLGESDVDCGGPQANRCGVTRRCATNADCLSSLFCDLRAASATCKVPAIDGTTNGDETDIDCGGTTSPACGDERGCSDGTSCTSLVCKADAPSAPEAAPAPSVGTKRCVAPMSNDGVRNGAETDVDCGGPGNPKCAVGKACSMHSDCASDGCHSAKKICVARRSCAMTFGGETCGGPAGSEAGGDDCCAAIEVQRADAAPKVALGKYKITAGRMRQMIERLNGDVRGYIAGLNLPAGRWDPSWSSWLPTNRAEVLKRLGPDAYPDEFGFGDITGARGCGVSGGGRPYWFTVAEGVAAYEVGLYPHDVLDQKVMTCLMPAVAAAFCIWDGGELADPLDVDYAWNGARATSATATVPNARKWPWGNAPEPPTTTYGAEAACQQSNCNQFIVHKWNYNYPAYRAPDSTSIIPPPGRRPAGAGPFGHMDLAGAGFEYAKRTFTTGTTPSTLHTMSTGSFETHEPTANLSYGSATLNRRYWAFTAGRCSYPAN